MNLATLEKYFPLLVVLVLGGWLFSKAAPPKPSPGGVDYAAIGRLPVLEGGRVMPFDALARTSLQSISGLTEVKNEHGEVVASAVEWLVQVFDNPDAHRGKAAEYKIFRIEHDQLLGVLELPRRPGFYRYSLKEIQQTEKKLMAEMRKAAQKREENKPLDLYDAKLEDLSRKVNQFTRLAATADQENERIIRPVPPETDGGDWQALKTIDLRAAQTMSEKEQAELSDAVQKEVWDDFTKMYGDLSKMPEPGQRMVAQAIDRQLRQALMQEGRNRREKVSLAAATFTNILDSARRDKGEFTAKFLEAYNSEFLNHVSQEDKSKNRLEAKWLGHFAPFYHCAFLYLPQVILALTGWLVWMRPLNKAALWLGVFTFAVHTLALILRMYVQGRPPVTNLYASAVFIGWGAVGLALLLEAYYKNGVGNLVAGTVGAATLELAHFLGGSGDTMAMLVAVLDTNFWLATHVTTVTLGYTATLVAGMIAVVYIIRGVCTTTLDDATAKSLAQMMYGVICFATLLSFVGTVLGGIWADYSWGRFWGWDPKENGAVLIVIWNALILHARWGGMVKVRGMAVLAIFGNMVTVWSWFGTNQLGIGLHAYGFDNRLATGCRYFWLSQLALMAVGMIPRQYWRSQPGQTKAAPVPEPVEKTVKVEKRKKG
jgi:ABC-type transport system involved in cytochrome c biogenesis permease subunit